MKPALMAIAACCTAMSFAAAANSPGPGATAPIAPIAAPRDLPYPGQIQLAVDATDIARRIVRVHETLSGIGPDTVLLYPQWLPGTHAPEGTVDRLAGLKVTANGTNTSPVVRGAWISERLLGQPVLPPPSGVPAIEPV